MDAPVSPTASPKANGVVLFTGDRATIQNLSGETGGGKIEISGFAGYGGGPVIFRLHAQAAQVRVRYPEGVSTIADASLESDRGRRIAAWLAGTITIRRAGFNTEADVGSLLAKSARAPVRTASTRNRFPGGA